MRLGILVIATGRYVEFVPQLWESVKTHMLPDTQDYVSMYVFTNRPLECRHEGRFRLQRVQQDWYGWPFSTLMRYSCFWRMKERLETETDVLLYLDADMRLVNPIGFDFMPVKPNCHLIVVQHPGFWRPDHAPFPHEGRRESSAFVPPERRAAYYCGGVQGGTTLSYLSACLMLRSSILNDLDRGIVAEWHDESHWNWYLSSFPQEHVLGPEYCVPEEFAEQWPVPPRILALKKNHAEWQGGAK